MAGRPATATNASSKHLTKQARSLRLEVEDMLGSKGVAPKAPNYLNKRQKAIYKWLVDNLNPSGFLGQLDKMTLSNASIIIERLESLDKAINDSDNFMLDVKLNAMRDKYFNQYIKICQELCLSPSARAKMGTLAVNATENKKDDLLEALKNAK